MADDPVTAEELAGLGHGGLCLDCQVCTFPNCGFGKIDLGRKQIQDPTGKICSGKEEKSVENIYTELLKRLKTGCPVCLDTELFRTAVPKSG